MQKKSFFIIDKNIKIPKVPSSAWLVLFFSPLGPSLPATPFSPGGPSMPGRPGGAITALGTREPGLALKGRYRSSSFLNIFLCICQRYDISTLWIEGWIFFFTQNYKGNGCKKRYATLRLATLGPKNMSKMSRMSRKISTKHSKNEPSSPNFLIAL